MDDAGQTGLVLCELQTLLLLADCSKLVLCELQTLLLLALASRLGASCQLSKRIRVAYSANSLPINCPKGSAFCKRQLKYFLYPTHSKKFISIFHVNSDSLVNSEMTQFFYLFYVFFRLQQYRTNHLRFPFFKRVITANNFFHGIELKL